MPITIINKQEKNIKKIEMFHLFVTKLHCTTRSPLFFPCIACASSPLRLEIFVYRRVSKHFMSSMKMQIIGN